MPLLSPATRIADRFARRDARSLAHSPQGDRMLRRLHALQAGKTIRRLGTPWFLLATRVWIGQVVFVHQIMSMVQGGSHGLLQGALSVPSSFDVAAHAAVPLLLSLGLLTRPLALVLLAGAFATGEGASASIASPLLIWLVVAGPGAFSLDALLARGAPFAPFGPLRRVRAFYQSLSVYLMPVLLFATRIGLGLALYLPFSHSASLAGMPMPMSLTMPFDAPAWAAIVLALALALGCATRVVAAICAVMIPLASVAMALDERLAVLLLLLGLVSGGAGMVSIDALLAKWALRKGDAQGAAGGDRPRVVVVGGGFAGVSTVYGLRNSRCDITLIDQRNYHLFQPLLYQTATAALSATEIATPIRSLFRGQRNVRILLGKVTGIDTSARDVLVSGSRVKYDYLVLATGARHSYFGKDDWAPFAPGLKTVEDATSIRSRLLKAFEAAESTADETARAAWLTFVIVGGGPTGIELAGAIAELARHGMDQEYHAIDPSKARVILLHAGARVLPTFHESLSAVAQRSLLGLGVDIRLETRVLGVDEEGVDVGQYRIAARTVLWAAGVAASAAAKWLGEPEDGSGRVKVGNDLSVPSQERIYAIGDTASSLAWRGAPVPGLAPAAKQQGKYVARAIDARLAGLPPPPAFRYRHFGSLATIGRQSAVVEIGRLRLWGGPAWWLWGAAHIMFLTGGRNRTAVAVDWLWAYLTYRRSTRLITEAGVASGDVNQET
jgi:NADH dehydrogenase FAD-containing subunit